MKKFLKIIAFAAIFPAFLAGCKAPVAQQSGKEDIAYLLFVSPNKKKKKKVTVSLDNQKPFSVQVVKEKKSKRKGTQYGVKTGARHIKVSYEGKTLYNKKIFISTQEVKQIILP